MPTYLPPSTRTFSFIDYGDYDNLELGMRFDVQRDQWPEYRLFVNGDIDHPINMTSIDRRADSIMRFVKANSGSERERHLVPYFFHTSLESFAQAYNYHWSPAWWSLMKL